MANNSPSNISRTRAELAQRHQDKSRQGSGIVTAYEDDAGVPRDIQGDTQAPWLKTPAFTEDPQPYERALLLSSAAYTALPRIDTRQYRCINFYLQYTIPMAGAPPAGLGRLSIIPEKLAIDPITGDDAWFTVPVFDPTLTLITPVAPFNALTLGVGSRNFYPTELRWPSAIVAGPLTLRMQLAFDVSDAVGIRLNVLELEVTADGENTLSIAYARNQ